MTTETTPARFEGTLDPLLACPFCGETPTHQPPDHLGPFVWHSSTWCPIAAPVKFKADVWNRREQANAPRQPVGEVREQTEARLGAILMPATPCGAGPGKDKPMAVPLAQELERLTEQINGLTNGMENMLSRVEL